MNTEFEIWKLLLKHDADNYFLRSYVSYTMGKSFEELLPAALVKVLGLDDTELKDFKYYPYEMAHFCE